MARYELKLPKMGESVAEATITSWLKEVGESIELDDTIVEVATDKVDSEVPSEVEGKLIEILYEKDPDRSIYPASMTKIMTSIIAFDLIKSGDLSLDDKFIISEKAWRLSTAGYSSMFIMVGDEVSVEDLLLGIIIAST